MNPRAHQRRLNHLLDKRTHDPNDDLRKAFRKQPPTSWDALLVAEHMSCVEECSCSMCSQAKKWYELAIEIDPNNPVPYERLAKRVDSPEQAWPLSILVPLRKEYDRETLLRVMHEYRTQVDAFAKECREVVAAEESL